MKTMRIELIIDNKIVEVLTQDEDKQIWHVQTGSWLYGNELVDYINWKFDNPPLFCDGIPF